MPMKRVENSASAVAQMNSLIDDWIENRSKFKYGAAQNLFKYGSRPTTDAAGLYDIDCSSFLQAVLEGIKYATSLYTPSAASNYSDLGTTMPFSTLTEPNHTINRRMLSSTLGEWAYNRGYWFAARPDFSNVKVGDALFWHAYPKVDSAGAPIWKQVSHTAFVTKILSDGYFEVADATEVTSAGMNLISRRTLHATDLHRYQVYSAARFPLDLMWSWGDSASKSAVTLGWSYEAAASRWAFLTSSTSRHRDGWFDIDGKRYYFDSEGYAVFGQVSIGGSTYYIDQNLGSISEAAWEDVLTERDKHFGEASKVYDHFTPETRGWQKINGSWFYFIPSSGFMVRDGWQSIYEPPLGRSSWNYCKHNGQCIDQLYKENAMTFMSIAGPADYARGWYTVDGFTRYFRETTTASMAEGFQQIDGNWYYLRQTTGTKAYGWQYVDGKWRYLDPSTGVLKLAGVHFIVDSYDAVTWSSGTGYYSVEQFITAPDGKKYVTVPGPGKYVTGYRNIGGSWYYFGTDGAMVTGWHYSDGTWHYYRTSGTSALGNQYIDGRWYYFASYNVGVATR
ncbi:N-acetylmuramoyl-L-alanine amidase family protein [Knoellia sp. LjRoot47]|uniref:N-acetylmuramoyl-L-alanine amidase family protein n=1 Tax=Knoellia sp. LjRoot47 TaxID=3342330 RepID=UPI003ED0CF54